MSITIPEYNIVVKVPEPTHYIYKITNESQASGTGKSYIGQTCNIQRRICEHLTGEGSRPLLQDITKHGVGKFTFEVLRCLYDEPHLDHLEDYYIRVFNSLAPNGYNLRLNAQIEPNFDDVETTFTIQAKFVFKNGIHKVFSVSEFTQARAYQTLTNLKATHQTNMCRKKKKGKFRYFELKIDSNRDFDKGKIYELNVKFDVIDDCFILQ